MPNVFTNNYRAAYLIFLVVATFSPPLANAMSLVSESSNEAKICTCDFTSALLTVEGKANEEYALIVETDGQIGVTAPQRIVANKPTRLYLSMACSTSEGEHIFQVTANSLQGGAAQQKFFSMQAVSCPKLILRRVATLAYCPSQADFEFELENTGLTAEKGEFTAQVVEGLAKFTPTRFSLAPGESTPVTLSVGVPTHLLSQPSSQEITVRAIGTRSVASTVVTLTLPLCTSAQPTLFPGAPSPTPILVSGGLGSVTGENFITGLFVAGRNGLASWLSGLRNTQISMPSTSGTAQNPVVVAAVVIILLLLIGGYAFHKDRQSKQEEQKLSEKRRERMRKIKGEM